MYSTCQEESHMNNAQLGETVCLMMKLTVFMFACVFMFLYVCLCEYVGICVRLCVHKRECMCVCLFLFLCLWLCVYVCVCVLCVCVYVCVCCMYYDVAYFANYGMFRSNIVRAAKKYSFWMIRTYTTTSISFWSFS